MIAVTEEKLLSIYKKLLTRYGRQQWWPAEGPFEVMLGAILTQNTHWSNVEKALLLLKQQVPLTAEAILKFIRHRFRNLFKAQRLFSD